MAGDPVSSALSAAGNIVAGFGSFFGARAKARALRAAARQARGEASMQAQMAVDEAQRAAARAAVSGAASGGGFEGSFGDVLADLEQTGTFNARSAIYAGNVEANNRIYESKVAKQQGWFDLASSALQATTSIAGDRMAAAEQRKQQAAKRELYTLGRGYR